MSKPELPKKPDAPAWASSKEDPKKDERLKKIIDDIEVGKNGRA